MKSIDNIKDNELVILWNKVIDNNGGLLYSNLPINIQKIIVDNDLKEFEENLFDNIYEFEKVESFLKELKMFGFYKEYVADILMVDYLKTRAEDFWVFDAYGNDMGTNKVYDEMFLFKDLDIHIQRKIVKKGIDFEIYENHDYYNKNIVFGFFELTCIKSKWDLFHWKLVERDNFLYFKDCNILEETLDLDDQVKVDILNEINIFNLKKHIR